MKALFIGGTGNISAAVSRAALEKGIDLYLLNRGQRSQFFPEGAKQITGDIRKPESVAGALKGMEFDVVVNWIGFNPDQIRTDLDLFRGKTGQYIYISSAAAYQKPVRDYLITESTLLANPYWQYARDKIACEDLLMNEYRNNGFPVTIVRPSHTYGVTSFPTNLDCKPKPWTLIDRIKRGKKIIIHGDGKSLWVLTHNTDFARGFIGLLGNIHAIGQAFHITSDEALTWNQIFELIGKAVGTWINPVYIPSEFLGQVIPSAQGVLFGDRAESVVFDNSKIKHFVPGFLAKVPFAEGIKMTIEWYEAHPEYCQIDQALNELMDKVIDTYESALGVARNKLLGNG